jgi:hypothetical protein
MEKLKKKKRQEVVVHSALKRSRPKFSMAGVLPINNSKGFKSLTRQIGTSFGSITAQGQSGTGSFLLATKATENRNRIVRKLLDLSMKSTSDFPANTHITPPNAS